MTIRIVPDGPDIELTESEYARLRGEYAKAFSHFAGIPPTFEEWVRSRKQKLLNETRVFNETTASAIDGH